MLSVLFQGIFIGLAISAPVGAIGILCIKKSLHQGFQAGVIAGLGAAIADTVYGIIAGFGLTFVTNFIEEHISWVKLFGGIILVLVGLKIYIKKTEQFNTQKDKTDNFHTLITTFILTLTNPLTMLAFIAIFAGLGLGYDGNNYLNATYLISGVFLGAFLWWVSLSGLVSVLHKKIDETLLVRINHYSGLAIMLFGAWAITTSFFKFSLLDLDFFSNL